MNKQEIFNEAYEYYLKLTSIIAEIYDKYLDNLESFEFEKKDLLLEMELYVEALLLKIALADKNFAYSEVQLLEKITDYGTLFNKINLVQLSDGDLSDKIALEALADSILEKKLPEVIYAAVYIDKQLSTSYTSKIKESFNQISLAMMQIDISCMETDMEVELEATQLVKEIMRINNLAESEGLKLVDL